MPVKKRPVDDEEEFEFDDEFEADEDDEDDEDSPEAWAKFVPDMKEAIVYGYLDPFLKELAFELRERYKQLNPDEFPGEVIRPRDDEGEDDAPRRSRRIVALDPGTILGQNGAQLPISRRGVGDTGPMPAGSFRLNGNAYSKALLKGVKFAQRGEYKAARRGIPTLPSGTVFEVVEALDVRFSARVVDPETQFAHLGASEIKAIKDVLLGFRYEFHSYLFDGGK